MAAAKYGLETREIISLALTRFSISLIGRIETGTSVDSSRMGFIFKVIYGTLTFDILRAYMPVPRRGNSGRIY